MSLNDLEQQDGTNYNVVVNHEEQYSIWPDYKEIPLGWKAVGKSGPKDVCLAYIKEVWTDMRPLSLRKKMEELAKNPPPPPAPPDPNRPREKSLVERLCEGTHPVEASLRAEKSAKKLKESIDRKYVHIRFPNTRGGTELGFSLNLGGCDLSQADFESGSGVVHLVGELTLDYQPVRCIADLDLASLSGTGHLEKIDRAMPA